MSSVLKSRPMFDAARWMPWLPLLAGIALLYVPTIVRLANGLWNEEANAHGPIILLVVLWLAWRQRAALARETPVAATATALGAVALAGGLLFYVIGRSQGIMLFEAGSTLPVLAGALLILRGWDGLRALWFPLLFLVFLVPLPGFAVDAITGPLKSQVSHVVEDMLYWAGYPIARSGVVLSIGSYQLLVADACSGLNSIFSLTALCLLYLHLTPVRSIARNVLLIMGIVPIAFVANVVRVTTLVLITYYFGDEAGQGFLHGFAGMVLFIAALLLLLAADAVLRRLLGVKSPALVQR
ncbi:MAG TPA: exosortase B [Burkholderiales bacterium]|nr:exosortase B [Burkholderiales bacterium]